MRTEMTKKPEISGYQLAAMLLVADGFSIFCLRGGISLLTIAALAAGGAVQLAAAAVLVTLRSRGVRLTALLTLLPVLHMTAVLILTMQTAEAVSIPHSGSIAGRVIIALSVCLTGGYAASSGIKPLARSAVIAGALGAVCVVLFSVSAAAVSIMHGTGIPAVHSPHSFFRELLYGAFSGSGAAAAAVLSEGAGSTPKRQIRLLSGCFAARLVLTAAAVISAVLAAGGIMEIAEFPVIMAAHLTQPLPSQRIDPLFMIVFSVSAVFSVSVQAAALISCDNGAQKRRNT